MKKILLIILVITVSLSAQSAKKLTEKLGCMECHDVNKRKSAPAFKKIAKKSIKWHGDSAQESLVASIKNGSRGKYRYFSDTTMPAYKKISDASLNNIANWILSTNKKGKKGIF